MRIMTNNKLMNANNAQQVIDETQATLSSDTINQLANAVTQAKSNLHGDTKLQHDKDSAKQTIAQLQNLNSAQNIWKIL